MRPLVEFCINNLTDDVLTLMKELEKDMDLDVLDYGCLGNCGICAESPYALVNGEVITAQTATDLKVKIYEVIEAMEIRF